MEMYRREKREERREKKMQRKREIVFYPFVMKLGIFCHLIWGIFIDRSPDKKLNVNILIFLLVFLSVTFS